MLNMQCNSSHTVKKEQSPLPSESQETIIHKRWPRQLLDVVRQHPLPAGSLLLLLISFFCWLGGRTDIAQWILLWLGMGLSVIAMGFAAFCAILQEGIDVLVILNALRVGRLVSSHVDREMVRNGT
jgi:hypothetical protein